MAFIMQESGDNQLAPSVSFSPSLGGGDAVTAGGGGGGGLGEPFDIEGGAVVRCALVFGRGLLECEDTTLPALAPGTDPSGVIYASVAHDGANPPELSVMHGESLPENGLDVTNRALYRAEGSPPSWTDMRKAVVVAAMAS